MSAALAPTMSPRGLALVRTFRAALAALGEHQKLQPGEVIEIAAFVMSHVRSAWPQALTAIPALDTGPIPRIEPAVVEIMRQLCDGGRYRLAYDEGHISLIVTDAEDTAAVALTPTMAAMLRDDIATIIGGL
jgi:hypothetical protein